MRVSKYTIAVPPGATIYEQLSNRNLSQKEFAKRMGMSEKHISHLINGKVELTTEVAISLEMVLGVPSKFWNNLESIYRDKLKRVELENAFEEEKDLASKFPYAKIAKVGFVPATSIMAEKIVNLRKFFEVANLKNLDNLVVPGIAYRRSGVNSESGYTLAAWTQMARLQSREVETDKIDLKKLKTKVREFKRYTQTSPNEFCVGLKAELAECGVALVFLPHIEGSRLNGASFLEGKKVVLGLTVRGRSADIFWFTFFHELHHIIEGHYKLEDGTTVEMESAADEFARDILVDRDEYSRYIEKNDFSLNSIKDFSKSQGVDPSIVLGRLQKEKLVGYDKHSSLKKKYMIS